MKVEGQWRWSDDIYTSQATIRWRFGQPDSATGDEDCAYLDHIGNNVFYLANFNCSRTMLYICEKVISTYLSPAP